MRVPDASRSGDPPIPDETVDGGSASPQEAAPGKFGYVVAFHASGRPRRSLTIIAWSRRDVLWTAMPIRAVHRWLYPLDWPHLSAVIRFERAQSRCEICGRPHAQTVSQLGDGRWYDEAAQSWRSGKGRLLPGMTDRGRTGALITKVVLHDHAEHRRRRWLTLHMRKALGDLFRGPYRL